MDADVTEIPIRPRAPGSAVPLTPPQMAFWRKVTMEGTRLSDGRVCSITTRVLGALDAGRMRVAIAELVQRHESLRTRISVAQGVPGLHVGELQDCHFEWVDLSRKSLADAESDARQYAQRFADEDIDLSVGPLFQAKLFRVSERDHILIVGFDHLFSDARSFEVINRETWELYRRATGETVSLEALPIQFPDYAVWLNRVYNTWLRHHQAYWENDLARAPRTQIPVDRRITGGEQSAAARRHIPFGRTLSDALRETARRERIRLPIVVMTVYAIVMSRWCCQEDIVIGVLSHARQGRPELESMIAPLTTTVFVRVWVGKRECPFELLRRLNSGFRAACEHQSIAGGGAVAECNTDLMFNWISTNWARCPADNATRTTHELRMQLFPVQRAAVFSRQDATAIRIAFCDTGAGIVAIVGYRSTHFDAISIDQFGRDLRRVSEELTKHPSGPVALGVLGP